MRWFGRAGWSTTTTLGNGTGAKGWAFKDVLPIFKAQEDWEGGANQWRGVGGAVHIRKPGDPHPTAPAFLEAARQMGFPIVDDVNGPMRAGAGYINMNIAADGSRVSSARAFLRPNLGRSNLTLLLNTNATKVLFDGDRASGIEIVSGETARAVRATREVILAAGTIHSAKLLMLSGVGDATELQKQGITAVANLRGVGRNLQDHVLLSGVVYQYKGKMPDRPADSDAVEAEVYLSSGLDNHPTDITLVLEQLPIATPEAAARFATPPKEGFTIAPALVQPTSRGQVRLASANWRDPPVIEANHLGTDHDLKAVVKAIEAARELGRQAAFDSIREAEVVPGPKAVSQPGPDRSRKNRLGQLRPCRRYCEDRCRHGCSGGQQAPSSWAARTARSRRLGYAIDHFRSGDQCSVMHDRRPCR